MSRETEVLWDQALQSFEAAKTLVELDPDSSVSRSYYAVFHAVNASFLWKTNRSRSTPLFERRYTEIWSKLRGGQAI